MEEFIPAALGHMRAYQLDGALLLFDRASGWNALLDGPETAHYRRVAPRVLQFALTNHCNLACTFCSRDEGAASLWTSSSALDFLAEMAGAGVMEVAFGGGEPLVFKGFAELVARLHDETPLAVSFTTNGTLLSARLLEQLAGKVGQVRLSVYDSGTSEWRTQVRLLAQSGVRFGINYLVTPDRLDGLQDAILELVELGATDLLLLSYNGMDPGLHLSAAETVALDAELAPLRGHAVGLRGVAKHGGHVETEIVDHPTDLLLAPRNISRATKAIRALADAEEVRILFHVFEWIDNQLDPAAVVAEATGNALFDVMLEDPGPTPEQVSAALTHVTGMEPSLAAHRVTTRTGLPEPWPRRVVQRVTRGHADELIEVLRSAGATATFRRSLG